MGRFQRRLSPVQRNVLTVIALIIAINVFIVSEYTLPRNVALSLDHVYDPLLNLSNAISLPQEGSGRYSPPHSVDSTRPRILLVSALFDLHSENSTTTARHRASLPRFLGPIITDVYFYTTPELASTVRAARGPALPMTVDTSFSSPFGVPPLKGRETVYQQMHEVDPEKDSRTPEAYALWNAKPFFLEHAIRSSKTEYDYIFWNDVDSFGEGHGYKSWPDAKRLDWIWDESSRSTSRLKEDLIFFPINEPPMEAAKDWSEDLGPIGAVFSEGALTFCSSHKSILRMSYRIFLWGTS